MGIRINTRLGKNTSASVPASWLLIGGLVALGMVCGLLRAAWDHPWATLLVTLLVLVPAAVITWLIIKGASWLADRL